MRYLSSRISIDGLENTGVARPGTRLTRNLLLSKAHDVPVRQRRRIPFHLITMLVRQMLLILPPFKAFFAATGVLLGVVSFSPTGEARAAAQAANDSGIEHLLYLTVGADADSHRWRQMRGDPVTAKLSVNVQISAHSRESNFYGVVSSRISEFDVVKGSPSREIWRDENCHHERGFPKITVVSLEGLVTSGAEHHPIYARIRKLGLLLPRDEVLAARRLNTSTDEIGYYIATRTETKQSRLFVELKLYTLPCELPAARQPGAK